MHTDKPTLIDVLKSKDKARNPIEHLVILSGDDSLETAMKKLSAFKIYAAPINLSEKSYGMVDLFGIAHALCSDETNIHKPLALLLDVIEVSQQHITLDEATPLDEALAVFAEEPIHRVLVTRADEPYEIITQMDVLRYFKLNFDKVSKKKVEDMMHTSFLSFKSSTKTKDAIKQLINKSFSGAAVVDDSDKVIYNFSIADLKDVNFSKDLAKQLELSLDKFFKLTKGDLRKLPITVKKDNELIDVIKLMVNNRIHRVHVVDDKDTVIGLVTSTDVMKHLVPSQKN